MLFEVISEAPCFTFLLCLIVEDRGAGGGGGGGSSRRTPSTVGIRLSQKSAVIFVGQANRRRADIWFEPGCFQRLFTAMGLPKKKKKNKRFQGKF